MIQSNKANSTGGGIAGVISKATFVLLVSTVDSNSANLGGGLYMFSSEIVLMQAIISNNVASANGGGIYTTTKNIALTNTNIIKNTA